MTDDILAGICAEYAPFNALPEFQHGFDAYGRFVDNPHNPDSVMAQAWDRGAEAAMRYARALAHSDTHAAEPVENTTWLARLQMGRR